MTTPGLAVLLASGKRGLLPSGPAALFNGDGECHSCCGYEIDLGTISNSTIGGAGWCEDFEVQPASPNAAGYAVAFADLPDGQSPGGDRIDLGYTWPFIVGGEEPYYDAILSIYGGFTKTDISAIIRPASAKLVVTVSNGGDDTWDAAGDDGISIDVYYKLNGVDFDSDLATAEADAIANGTLAGTIVMTGAESQKSVEYVLDPADLNIDDFVLGAWPDYTDDPGFPGSAALYLRSVVVTAKLRYYEGRWVEGNWAEGDFIE